MKRSGLSVKNVARSFGFSDEVKKFTPKALSITKYVVHANNLINKEMYESLLSFKMKLVFILQ